jgi:hypothetical protein
MILVFLRWTLLCMCRKRCNGWTGTYGESSFFMVAFVVLYWVFLTPLSAHHELLKSCTLRCSSLLTRWQVLSPAVPVEEEIWTAANPEASTEVLKFLLSHHGCSGDSVLLRVGWNARLATWEKKLNTARHYHGVSQQIQTLCLMLSMDRAS